MCAFVLAVYTPKNVTIVHHPALLYTCTCSMAVYWIWLCESAREGPPPTWWLFPIVYALIRQQQQQHAEVQFRRNLMYHAAISERHKADSAVSSLSGLWGFITPYIFIDEFESVRDTPRVSAAPYSYGLSPLSTSVIQRGSVSTLVSSVCLPPSAWI